MRELIQKGDPLVRVNMPKYIREALTISAKHNKRKFQDEVIKRLTMTFKFPEALLELQYDVLVDVIDPAAEKWAQVIPLEMVQVISQASTKKGLSVGEELLSRILATLKYPEQFGVNPLEVAIMQRKFTPKEAAAECDRRREGWVYLYEMCKLRLFIEFCPKLPRHVKENFTSIDVKALTKEIKAELRFKKRIAE